MNAKLKVLSFMAMAALAAVSCSEDEADDAVPENNNNNQNNNTNNNGGGVKITGTSPDYTFWGDELTITGTGFSAVKGENKIRFIQYSSADRSINYVSDGGDIEITSASETQLKIRIPYGTEVKATSDDYFGLDDTRIEVTVKEKKDTTDGRVKFVGLPNVGAFDYHYGWYALGGVTRIGDSVLISHGFSGSILGAGRLHPQAAGYWDKLRLKIDGAPVPMKNRKISSSIYGWALYLPTKDFAELNCSEGENGWNDRGMTFEFYVEGTDKKDQRKLFVQYLPTQSVTSVDGVSNVSKSAGGVPAWTVRGVDMYFTTARFVPSAECPGVNETTIGLQNPDIYASELIVGIPLSQMAAGCSYKVVLEDPCGGQKGIGGISVKD